MPKNATLWSANPSALTKQRIYDTTTLYDSGTLTYDGIISGQSLISAKYATNWSNASKNATNWVINPSAVTGLDNYDSSTDSYDGSGTTSAIDNYDSVVSGQSTVTAKSPTAWSNN